MSRKCMLVIIALGLSAGTALAGATSAYMRFEVNGSSVVQWDDIKDGFALDIIVGNDDPLGMCAFQVMLDGDPGFAYAAVTSANYNSALNWDPDWGLYPPAGHLPMVDVPGDPDDMIATIYGTTWAQNGRAATVFFTAAPPRGDYVIGIDNHWTMVGDTDFVEFTLGSPLCPLTLTPLTILVPEPGPLLLLALSSTLLFRQRRQSF
ncbi:MAG: PEP-CTERM sorting domain-containing protein [Planctomycetes bacterium]|nr:PEP-CTERM sorting domain-containing protein [Planctomycetota bacterium]